MHMKSNTRCCADACLKAWYSTVQETSINSHIALLPNNKRVKDMFDRQHWQFWKTTFKMQCLTKIIGSNLKNTTKNNNTNTQKINKTAFSKMC